MLLTHPFFCRAKQFTKKLSSWLFKAAINMVMLYVTKVKAFNNFQLYKYSDPPYFAVSVLRGVFLRIRENSRNIRRKPQKAQTNFSNHARVTSASLGYIRPESAAERGNRDT